MINSLGGVEAGIFLSLSNGRYFNLNSLILRYNDFKCLHYLINIEESSGIFGPEQLSHQQSLQGKEG